MHKLSSALLLLLPTIVQAEIVTDGTLGGAATALTGPDFAITADLGQQSGGNLFHSFSHFNLAAGESATFSGPTDVNNIISRVTGGESSMVNGLLASTIDEANLFFLNPQGFVIGSGATLDISGSLHVSSGDYLVMDDLTQFQAMPQAGEILSTASPQAFGFLGEDSGAIQIQGAALTLSGGNNTMTFAANGISLNNATLTVEQGAVQLISPASAGEVALATGEAQGVVNYADIAIVENSTITVEGVGASRMLIQGQNIVVRDSTVSARTQTGIDGLGLTVEAAGALNLQAGAIETVTTDSAQGSDLLVNADSVKLTGGASMVTRTSGTGKGGQIDLQIAGDLSINTPDSVASAGIFSSTRGTGDSGTIVLAADNVAIHKGGSITVRTSGDGDAGNISLSVDEHLSVEGFATDSAVTLNTGIFNNADANSTGSAGGIEITAGAMTLINQGAISSINIGSGPAGNILLAVSGDVSFSGQSIMTTQAIDGFDVDAPAVIQLTADNLFLKDSSFISTSTQGSAEAGNIDLQVAGAVVLAGNADIASSNAGSASAGNVTLTAATLTLSDGSSINTDANNDATRAGSVVIELSGALTLLTGSRITTGAVDGSDPNRPALVRVVARDLWLQDGSAIVVNASGSADAGFIDLTIADTVVLQQESSLSSANFGSGRSGSVTLVAGDVSLTDGSFISTENRGGTDAADASFILLTAEEVLLDSAKVFSNASGEADAGNVELVVSGRVAMALGSNISSSSSGTGSAGKVDLSAGDLTLDDKSSIRTDAAEGGARAGSVNVHLSDTLSLLNGSSITTETVDGFDAAVPALVQVNAGDLILNEGAIISTNSTGTADAGEIRLNITDTVQLFDGSSLSTASTGGGGGQIAVVTDELLRLRDSAITTSVAQGSGDGGDIFVDPVFIVLDNSAITANAFAGDGGNITLVADYILQSIDSDISASSALGVDGEVNIQTLDADVDTGEERLSVDFLNVERWAQQACSRRLGNEVSSFIISRPRSRPAPYDDWFGSPIR